MITVFTDVTVWALMIAAGWFTAALTTSIFMEPLRKRFSVFGCPVCLGVWVGAALAGFIPGVLSGSGAMVALTWLAFGMFVSMFAALSYYGISKLD